MLKKSNNEKAKEIIEELEKLQETGGNLLALEPKILEANNAELSYWFHMNVKGANKEAHRMVIINSKNPRINYNIALKITSLSEQEGENPHLEIIRLFGQAVIDSKDQEYNYLFAKYVKGADRKAHAKVVLDGKDVKYNYLFAKYIKGANIKAHGQVVLDSKDAEYNYVFACYVEGADIKAHEQVVIDSQDPEYNYLFARDIKGADIKAHEQIVLGSKDLDFNYRFAYIEGADIRAHGRVIIASGDPEYNYLFARDVKGADKNAHAKVVLASENPSYKHSFVRDIPGVKVIEKKTTPMALTKTIESSLDDLIKVKKNKGFRLKFFFLDST